MRIEIGRYTLRSDGLCLWIEEEYEITNKKTGKTKKLTRRVAGYATSWSNLVYQFCSHRYMNSDAESVREFLKDMEQTFQDMLMLNEAAVKKDFRMVKKTAKERKIK